MQRIFFILLNLFAFPGLGTLCSGRIRMGVYQLVLAALGFILSLWGSGILISKILFSGLPPELLSQAIADETLMPLSDLLFHFTIALIGLTFFSVAWIWAALTSQIRKTVPPVLPAS